MEISTEIEQNLVKNKNTNFNEQKIGLEEKNKQKEFVENKTFTEDLEQDNMIDRKKSSDSTSISLSQEENFSQASEISLLYPYNSNINTQRTNISRINSNNLCQETNYFYGIENYFFKIMPEKFSEYKNSRNYLPKNNNKVNEEVINEFKNEIVDENKIKIEDNKFNNYCMANNFYNPIYANIFYYTYNNLFFNYQNQNIRNNSNNTYNNSNINKNINQEKKEKNKDNIISKEKNKKIEKNFVNSSDEQDLNIYIIKKINKNKRLVNIH